VKRWFWLTAGLLVWATHFIGLYLISSADDVWSSGDAQISRRVAFVFSIACLAAVSGVAARLWRRRDDVSGYEAWEVQVGLTGTLVAAIGVIWQTAPLAF